jgi:hypothetical protein
LFLPCVSGGLARRHDVILTFDKHGCHELFRSVCHRLPPFRLFLRMTLIGLRRRGL